MTVEKPDDQRHWDDVYTRKGADHVSWFRPHLDRSLALVDAAQLPASASLIDVGAGASTLVDDLLTRGYRNLTVLDLAPQALELARTRLGDRASGVTWMVGDVTTAPLPGGAFDFWHDRAVFHFLADPKARQRYVAQVRKAVKPGGHVVVATFGLEGPDRCSGLEAARYSADGLHAQFGSAFRKVSSATELHETPWGSEQQFVYCYCRLSE